MPAPPAALAFWAGIERAEGSSGVPEAQLIMTILKFLSAYGQN
jgi:hypothetical protein